MTTSRNMQKIEFVGLYVVPGEGTVAALNNGEGTQLYDKQGLSYLIKEKKKAGLDSDVEEQALAGINLQDSSGGNFY